MGTKSVCAPKLVHSGRLQVLRRSLIACQATTNTHRQYEATMRRLAHPSNPSTPGGRDFGACSGKWPPLALASCMVIRTNVATNSTTLIQLRLAIHRSVFLVLLHASVRPRLALSSNAATGKPPTPRDRKSTRLNSSHRCISYAVFCLKKKIQ